MATVWLVCPSCRKAGKAPDSVVGSKVTCRHCHASFTATADHVTPLASSTNPTPTPPVQVVPQPPIPIVQAMLYPQQQPLQYVQVNIPPGRRANALGVTSLVFGVIALVGCWIPFCGLVSWPIAGLGAIFGIIGLIVGAVDKQSGMTSAIAGLISCFVAVIVSFAITGYTSMAINQATEDQKKAELQAKQAASVSRPAESAPPPPPGPNPAP